jgi:hypothetical protein
VKNKVWAKFALTLFASAVEADRESRSSRRITLLPAHLMISPHRCFHPSVAQLGSKELPANSEPDDGSNKMERRGLGDSAGVL